FSQRYAGTPGLNTQTKSASTSGGTCPLMLFVCNPKTTFNDALDACAGLSSRHAAAALCLVWDVPSRLTGPMTKLEQALQVSGDEGRELLADLASAVYQSD